VKRQFESPILKKHTAVYYLCNSCDFLFIDNPTWLNEAYEDPINVTDTGLLARNMSCSRETAILCYFLNKKGKFLDYAGGYGILTRLMRDIGFSFYWWDPYCENLLAKGFERSKSETKYDLVTCFETVEHMTDPMESLNEMLSISDNVLLSTVLLPRPVPQPSEWGYYSLSQGQHISFFSEKTFQVIAERTGCYFYQLRSRRFLLTKHRLSSLSRVLLKHCNRDLLFGYIRRQMKSLTGRDNSVLAAERQLE